MIKKNLYKKNLAIVNKIEKIRSKNNVNWMNLVRLSFKYDAKNSAKIMSNVLTDDKKISKLVSQLTKLNKF
tara:strand:+ start:1390 stop:1602 length:213 start_codon:yes stop_codon:yes gene_type:complete